MKITNIFLFMLLLSGGYPEGTNAAFPIPDKLVIMTTEFESYRRIMIKIESFQDSPLHFPEPILVVGESNETFDIILRPQAPMIYVGKYRKQTGRYHPIDLQIAEKDSITLNVRGRVNPFERIVSYKLLGENEFYFDIYPQLPNQTHFQERTIPGNEKKVSKLPVITSLDGDRKGPSPQIPQSVFVMDRNILTKALFIAFIILGILIVVGIGGMFLWNYISKQKHISKSVVPMTPQPENSIPEPIEFAPKQPTQKENLNPQEKESLIRRIMVERGMSFDEARMVVDIRGKSFNVSA